MGAERRPQHDPVGPQPERLPERDGSFVERQRADFDLTRPERGHDLPDADASTKACATSGCADFATPDRWARR
jgi:hypothetical protein